MIPSASDLARTQSTALRLGRRWLLEEARGYRSLLRVVLQLTKQKVGILQDAIRHTFAHTIRTKPESDPSQKLRSLKNAPFDVDEKISQLRNPDSRIGNLIQEASSNVEDDDDDDTESEQPVPEMESGSAAHRNPNSREEIAFEKLEPIATPIPEPVHQPRKKDPITAEIETKLSGVLGGKNGPISWESRIPTTKEMMAAFHSNDFLEVHRLLLTGLVSIEREEARWLEANASASNAHAMKRAAQKMLELQRFAEDALYFLQ